MKKMFLKRSQKETLAQIYTCKFCKIFKNNFFKEHLQISEPVTILDPFHGIVPIYFVAFQYSANNPFKGTLA